MSEENTRQLTITGCEKIYSGTNRKGEPYDLYEIHAVNENGVVVEQQLRSFEQLDIGLQAEFSISKYDDPQRGTTFTLFQKKERLGPRVKKLESFCEELDKRLRAVEGAQKREPERPPSDPGDPPPIEQDHEADARFGGDDDIPF